MLAPPALAQGPLSEPFPAVLELAALDGDLGFRIDGAVENDRSGRSIASAGDVNGDGIGDLIIGAPGFDAGGIEGTGAAFVVFGSAEPRDPAFDLRGIDGTNGFRLDGVSEAGLVGSSVSAAGDVNGDGIDDLIIGAWYADPSGRENAGESYVVFGRDPGGACEADLDGDGELAIFDFLAFGNLFDLMDPAADFDGDGDFTIFDFLAFQNAFDAGCE